MKTINYIFLLCVALSFSSQLSGQDNMTIRSGAQVTVNGNTNILPPIFNCGDPFLDSRDGKVYGTTWIAFQCWMTQNLNLGVRIEGQFDQTNNGMFEKYCYDDNEANCNLFGGLYQWDEAMQYSLTSGGQGICPSGWHLPSDDEWCFMTQYWDPMVQCEYGWDGLDAGTKMKSTSGWNYSGNGTNESGFSGLPGGIKDIDDEFVHHGFYGVFWSSTLFDLSNGWMRNLSCFNTEIGKSGEARQSGVSVRCVMDFKK
jgi:uncharacterized protein (TIGR02145 family)